MSKKTFLILTILMLIFSLLSFNNLVSLEPSQNVLSSKFVDELEEIQYAEFIADVREGTLTTVYFEADAPYFFTEKEDTVYKVINPEYENFKRDMLESSVNVYTFSELNTHLQSATKNVYSAKHYIRFTIFILSLMTTVYFLIRFLTTKGNHHPTYREVIMPTPKQNNPEKTPESTSYKTQTFNDVAGLHEVKKDVQCLVDFLKNNEKYTKAGAKLPKGVIFYGPPGTGKTLLARAIAGEAGIPFHYMSGSDFIEMYVGVGAKRVRELFADAKKKAPCIIFIDEIDAIGSNRGNEETHAEDRKTLNALLTEMDGFKSSDNILVIGATNRIEDLDQALLRPGRFTNKYCVPLPANAKERLEIIMLYAKGKRFAEDVSFDALSKETIGFSPAAIESLLNEAAIISVQDKKRFIDRASIDKAMMKVLLQGHIKENQGDRSKEELETVAWHEAGHALVGKLCGKEIPKVTILSSTSGAGGVTFTTPKETGLHSLDDLRNEVKELYAGRVAEMLMSDGTKITTGASNDIEKATHIIKSIVTSFGMSEEYGLLNLNHLKVGQDTIISKEVKIAKELEKETTEMLQQNFDTLKQIAEALLESETLYDADLNAIICSAGSDCSELCSDEIPTYETVTA